MVSHTEKGAASASCRKHHAHKAVRVQSPDKSRNASRVGHRADAAEDTSSEDLEVQQVDRYPALKSAASFSMQELQLSTCAIGSCQV